MVNPYASEDFNRIRVNPRDRANEESKGIENPLIPGQKLDMTYKELNTFTKAMKDDEFKKLMSNYVDEISDPKHRPELDQYLDELVERGELPPGAALIQPLAGFCIKTSAKRLTNDKQKKFFEQKCFINVCWHETLEKPRQQTETRPDGTKGQAWSLPYRVSKGKPDQDAKGELCMTYDAVFHPDVANFCQFNTEFKKFCADTAIDGVNKVIAENREKMSTDYKILKHIQCKGERPNKMMVKTAKTQENELLANMDLSKQETKLQKEINEKQAQYREEETKKKELEAEKQKALQEQETKEELDGEKSDDERPEGII